MTIMKRDFPDYMKPQSEIEALHADLIDAFSAWAITKEARYIAEYHNIYHKLLSVGWDQDLDLDEFLPTDFMPDDFPFPVGTPFFTERTTKYRPIPDQLSLEEKFETLRADLHDALEGWHTSQERRFLADYHNTYHRVHSLGLTEELSLEEQLPEDLMPRDFTSKYWPPE
jgi:hypothetical protein